MVGRGGGGRLLIRDLGVGGFPAVTPTWTPPRIGVRGDEGFGTTKEGSRGLAWRLGVFYQSATEPSSKYCSPPSSRW